MGGAAIDTGCQATLEKLFVAGEDAGGVHGANRLGGNGICDSSVFGRQAGKSIASHLRNGGNRTIQRTRRGQIEDTIALLTAPLSRAAGPNPFEVRKQLQELNWAKVGVARTEEDLGAAVQEIESCADAVARLKVTGGPAYNMMYTAALDLRSMVDVSRMVAASALERKETRGAHFRQDCPKQDDRYGLFNILLTRGPDGLPTLTTAPVVFKHKSLGECQQYRK
jgi:succinate dehydrogenase / fumarate reductase flavoprotein subunit/fumarate reductase flavoprotein subunit